MMTTSMPRILRYFSDSHQDPNADRPKTYIATQGPLSSTVNDFWRMIWNENTGVILMLAKEVEGMKVTPLPHSQVKVDRYWPNDLNAAVRYGNIVVEMIFEEEKRGICKRIFKVKSTDRSEVLQRRGQRVRG